MKNENSALVVVDMQNDFITGTLGSSAAEAIVPLVENYIKNFNGQIIYATQDMHTDEDYEKFIEGQKIPKHCMVGTKGSYLEKSIDAVISDRWFGQSAAEIKILPYGTRVFHKNTFGSINLMNEVAQDVKDFGIDTIYIVGLCTNICVISNALMLRAACPKTKIVVLENLCAGTSPEAHTAACEVMEANCIEIVTYISMNR